MVNGFNGLGLATLTSIASLFPDQFRNVVFISVGEVDSALFKGPEELQQLRPGSPTICWSIASSRRTSASMPNCAPRSGPTWCWSFAGYASRSPRESGTPCSLRDNWFSAATSTASSAESLHNHTALDLLQSLQADGLSLVILPVRVMPVRTPETVPATVPAAVPA